MEIQVNIINETVLLVYKMINVTVLLTLKIILYTVLSYYY